MAIDRILVRVTAALWLLAALVASSEAMVLSPLVPCDSCTWLSRIPQRSLTEDGITWVTTVEHDDVSVWIAVERLQSGAAASYAYGIVSANQSLGADTRAVVSAPVRWADALLVFWALQDTGGVDALNVTTLDPVTLAVQRTLSLGDSGLGERQYFFTDAQRHVAWFGVYDYGAAQTALYPLDLDTLRWGSPSTVGLLLQFDAQPPRLAGTPGNASSPATVLSAVGQFAQVSVTRLEYPTWVVRQTGTVPTWGDVLDMDLLTADKLALLTKTRDPDTSAYQLALSVLDLPTLTFDTIGPVGNRSATDPVLSRVARIADTEVLIAAVQDPGATRLVRVETPTVTAVDALDTAGLVVSDVYVESPWSALASRQSRTGRDGDKTLQEACVMLGRKYYGFVSWSERAKQDVQGTIE